MNENINNFIEYFRSNINPEHFLTYIFNEFDKSEIFIFFLITFEDYFIENFREIFEKIDFRNTSSENLRFITIFIQRLLEPPFSNPDKNNFLHYSINDTFNYIRIIKNNIFYYPKFIENLYIKFFLVASTIRPTESIKLQDDFEKQAYKKFIQLKVLDNRTFYNKRLQLSIDNMKYYPFGEQYNNYKSIKDNKIVELPEEIIQYISKYLYGKRRNRRSKRKY